MAHATLPMSQLVPTHHGASCRECPPVQPALMSVEMALDIWKWPFPWTCPTSSRWLGNDLQEPVGNKGRHHFQMSGTSTPKGTASTVHHIGTFPQLEDQMTNFTSDIDRVAAG